MRLLLIRHGQASFGAADYDRLSPLGERQSRLLGQHFARTGYAPAAWCSGTLTRQRDTLSGISAGLSSVLDGEALPAFDEYDHVALLRAYLPRAQAELGQPDTAALYADPTRFQQAFARVMQHWAAGSASDHSLESWGQFRTRIAQGLAELAARHEGRRVALVTSGGPIACAIGLALGLDAETTFRLNWTIYNGSLSELRLKHGRWSLHGFNAVPHFELAGDPALLTYR